MASSSSSSNKSHQVFINHRGVDVKKTFVRYLYRRLREKGLTAFFDEEEIQAGYDIWSQIVDAIRTASVHVAIFSPRYAESEWCLNELSLMLKSNAPIVPVYYRVKPREVRWMLGLYGEALATHENKMRHDPSTIEEWRNALHQVANKSGFELQKDNDGEDLALELLDEVVECLAANANKKSHQVYINYSEFDVTKTFPRSLYRRLREKGLMAFLDEQELQAGYDIWSQRVDAIRTASVHVAVFSPRYAESAGCLNELLLMLKSNAPIVPVFYRVSPAEVRWMRGLYGEALATHEKKGPHDPSTIEEWRNALHQVANKSGFELHEDNDGQELVLELLDKVVKRLLEMVQQQDRKPQILGIGG